MSKLALLAAAGVGYVLGARAGRDRYDTIQAQAQRVWSNPRVQEKAGQAQQVVKDVGSDLGGKAKDVGSDLVDKAKDVGGDLSAKAKAKVSSGSDDAAPTPADMPATTGETELGRGSTGV